MVIVLGYLDVPGDQPERLTEVSSPNAHHLSLGLEDAVAAAAKYAALENARDWHGAAPKRAFAKWNRVNCRDREREELHEAPRTEHYVYFAMRRAEVFSDPGIVRYLKHHIVNEVYRALLEPGRGSPIRHRLHTLRAEACVRADPELETRPRHFCRADPKWHSDGKRSCHAERLHLMPTTSIYRRDRIHVRSTVGGSVVNADTRTFSS